ncbi:MAG: host specificity protein J, partial [Dolichospermum sp.]
MSKKQFKGFGGSGGGGGPTTTPTSGTSTSVVSVLGVVSEGEIEGLINGLKSIFLDETPIQNDDDSLNFKDFTWDYRLGTQGQSRIPGFADEVTSETSVNTEVKYNLPVTRTITNANLDIIRIRLGIILQEYPPGGGVLGLNVGFKIWIKQGAGAFVLVGEGDLGGRFPTITEFEYAFAVNNALGTVSNFSVRVERTTPQDTDETRYQRILRWQSYVEATETKLAYPNSALFGFGFKAAEFQSLPQVSLKLAGRKIRIPSNATPTTTRGLTFSGIWDGTFVTPSVAVADPAWILYDLITNTRYGLGRYINQSQIDKWALYEISQYCNEYVPDGYGGTEHRFQCHLLLEGKDEAYKVIQQFLSVFRGFSYWISGAIGFVSDKPGSAVTQFTQSDIEEGMFSYTRTGLKTRHTVALVSWVNPDDFYRQSVEAIDDPNGIAKYGVREIEVSAFACTSRGQARRAGYATLLTDRLEQETVTFKCRAYGTYVKPGDIIRIMDSKRADIRYGGLIAASTTTSITLDNPVEILENEVYSLTVMLADGTIQERVVTNSPEATATILTLDLALSSAPPPESNWILASSTVQPQLFRVINRVPSSGSTEMMHEITAIEYNPTKYSQIENGWSLDPLPPRRNPPVVVSMPRNIALSYQTLDLFDLNVVWDFPLLNGERDPFITSYRIELRLGDNGFWGNTRSETNTSTQFTNISAGKYYVRVAAINLNGKSSPWLVSNPITLSKNNWVSVFTS